MATCSDESPVNPGFAGPGPDAVFSAGLADNEFRIQL